MSKKETQDKDQIRKIISLFILVSALIVYAFLSNTGKTTEGFLSSGLRQLVLADVLVKEQENGTFVHASGRGFFHITKDGISYMSSTGQVRWSDVLNVTAPMYVAEADIVAISEHRSRVISVYSSSGERYEKVLDDPILSFSVNKNGYLSVITQSSERYIIHVFDGDGKWSSSADFPERNVFPVATAISNDNRYIAISLLNINGVKMSSEVILVHFGHTEALDFKDGIFASTGTKEDMLISLVRFMEGNHLVWVSDQQIGCGIIEENGAARYTHKWDLELTNKLEHIQFNDGKSISFAVGTPLINKESAEVGTVYQYGLSKDLLSTSKTGEKVTYLFAAMDSTIIGNDRSFHAINKSGSVLWSYTATKDVRQIVFIENSNKALLVSNKDTSLMTAQRTRQESSDIGDEIHHEIELIGQEQDESGIPSGQEEDVMYFEPSENQTELPPEEEGVPKDVSEEESETAEN